MFDLQSWLDKATFKEVLGVMIRGLQNPKVGIKMNTFGVLEKGICYGCAATNAICELTGSKPQIGIGEYYDLDPEYYPSVYNLEDQVNCISGFEIAIDSLRLGRLNKYNRYMSEITDNEDVLFRGDNPDLPYLFDENYKADLQSYIDFKNSL